MISNSKKTNKISKKSMSFWKWYRQNQEFYMEFTEFVRELLEIRLSHLARRKKMKVDFRPTGQMEKGG